VLNQDFLKNTILFNDMSEEELLEVVYIGRVKKYAAGTVIFEEGDPGDTFFLILNGCVRISKVRGDNEEALAVLENKSFFGEMTLFDRQPRSAHAIAHEDTELFMIAVDDLIKLFEKNKSIAYKFLWAFCLTLTTRLRSTNEKFEVIMSLANDGF
jgi:CRP-like cAMP-binding protein